MSLFFKCPSRGSHLFYSLNYFLIFFGFEKGQNRPIYSTKMSIFKLKSKHMPRIKYVQQHKYRFMGDTINQRPQSPKSLSFSFFFGGFYWSIYRFSFSILFRIWWIFSMNISFYKWFIFWVFKLRFTALKSTSYLYYMQL